MDKTELNKYLKELESNENFQIYFWKKLANLKNPQKWLKPLYEKEFFSPKYYKFSKEIENQPGHFDIPFWHPSEFLEKVSKYNEENNNEEVTHILVKILEEFVNYEFNNDRNYNIDKAFLKIMFYLPKEKFNIRYIDSIQKMLESKWDTTIIQANITKNIFKKSKYYGKDVFLRFLDIILSYNTKNEEYVSIFNKFYFLNLLKRNKEWISEFCALDSLKIALKKIDLIVSDDEFQFIQSLIPSIENNPQNNYLEEKYELQLVYFIRDMFMYLIKNEFYNELKLCTNKLISKEHEIFKRFVLFLVTYDYDNLNNIFWTMNNFNPFEMGLRRESFLFLTENHDKFNKSNLKQIISWINEVVDEDNLGKKNSSYSKWKLLSPLKELEEEIIQDFIKEHQPNVRSEIKYDGFESGIYFSGLVSPKLVDFDDMSIDKIVDCLNNPPKNEDIFEKTDINESLRRSAVNNPEKFVENICYFSFGNVSIKNIAYLFYGLSEAKKKGKIFNFSDSLSFIEKVLDHISKNEVTKFDNLNELLNAIHFFIRIFVENYENTYFVNLKNIISLLIKISGRLDHDTKDYSQDILFKVMNSNKGRSYDILLKLYFRNYSTNKKFDSNLKSLIESEIKNNLSFELSFVMGGYFICFWMHDKILAKKYFSLIFPDDNSRFIAPFCGCLIRFNNYNYDLIELFNKKNYYEKFINNVECNDRNIIDRLNQYIIIMYLNNKMENKENDLIHRLIKSNKIKYIDSFVRVFVWFESEVSDEIIKELWKEICSSKPKYFNEISENILNWTKLISDLDDDFTNLIIVTIKNLDVYPHFNNVFDFLKVNIHENPENVGKIFEEIAKYTPTYPQEDIITLIEELFNQNEKIAANNICREYLENNIIFYNDSGLRDIYNKNNMII